MCEITIGTIEESAICNHRLPINPTLLKLPGRNLTSMGIVHSPVSTAKLVSAENLKTVTGTFFHTN